MMPTHGRAYCPACHMGSAASDYPFLVQVLVSGWT